MFKHSISFTFTRLNKKLFLKASCKTFGNKTCTPEETCFEIENDFVCQKPKYSYVVTSTFVLFFVFTC